MVELRKAGIGGHIAGLFVGAVLFADDLLLLAPNRDAAQKMLKICESFATNSNIRFSTDPDPSRSKSKAIYVIGKGVNSPQKPAPLILFGMQLPWVNRADHLGVTLTEDGELLQDCKQKRAAYIDKCAQVRESFHFSHPMEKLIATEKYCTNIHGSVLWDLSSKEALMIFSAWRTGAKLSWDVPRSTHTYFVQEVLTPNIQSLELRILRNFVGFFQSLP